MHRRTNRALISLAVLALVLLTPATASASESEPPSFIGWVVEIIAGLFDSGETLNESETEPPPDDEAGGMVVPIG